MAISNKQARLISAIRDAMECQGVSQSELSRKAGTSQGMMSQALGGKGSMGEEKWRMCCEALGLNYDEVVADPDPETVASVIHAAKVQQEEREHCETAAKEEEKKSVEELPDTVNTVAARYIAEKLKKEIRHGTEIGLNDLYMLLKFCDGAIAG